LASQKHGAGVRFESKETVTGRVRGTDEWIEYRAILRVEDSGKNPVSLELAFVPPHPFVVNMPERKSLKAESIAKVFSGLVRFLDEYDVEFEC